MPSSTCQTTTCDGTPKGTQPFPMHCRECARKMAALRRCNLIFGHIAGGEVCDWAPSRFKEMPHA